MSLTIAGINFDQHRYDARGDVLYLSVEGYEGPPAKAFSTPEGHNVEYDEDWRPIAMTLVNVKWLLDRDGELRVTWPAVAVGPNDLLPVLSPAT